MHGMLVGGRGSQWVKIDWGVFGRFWVGGGPPPPPVLKDPWSWYDNRCVALARGLLQEMKKHGCTVLSHGATGRGNDQVRFERYVNVIDPDFKVYAPWRDPAHAICWVPFHQTVFVPSNATTLTSCTSLCGFQSHGGSAPKPGQLFVEGVCAGCWQSLNKNATKFSRGFGRMNFQHIWQTKVPSLMTLSNWMVLLYWKSSQAACRCCHSWRIMAFSTPSFHKQGQFLFGPQRKGVVAYDLSCHSLEGTLSFDVVLN